MLTRSQACARYGVTVKQLDYWARCGYLGEHLRNAGSGYDRDYTGTGHRIIACSVLFARPTREQVREALDILATGEPVLIRSQHGHAEWHLRRTEGNPS